MVYSKSNVDKRAYRNAYNLKWVENNWESYLWSLAKRRAKRDNIDFTILVGDIVIPTICPVLNIPLVKNRGKCSFNSASVDRINPKLGYVKGNIMVISFKANLMKNDASFEEIEKLYFYMKSLNDKTHI